MNRFNVLQFCVSNNNVVKFLSIEWNSIRLSDPALGIVTKTVHKTLPGGGGGGRGGVVVGVVWWGWGGGGGEVVGMGWC